MIIRRFSVFLFIGYYSPHPTLRILHIALVAGDNMHVDMKNRLSCCFVHIYADIISVRMETLINALFYIQKHNVHSFTLMVSKIKIRCNMSFGNYQRMTRRNRITIIESHTRAVSQIISTRLERRQKGHFSPSFRGSLLK